MKSFDPTVFFENDPDGILLVEGKTLRYQNPAAEALLASCALSVQVGKKVPETLLRPKEEPLCGDLRPLGHGLLRVESRPCPLTESGEGTLLTLRPMELSGLPAQQLRQLLQRFQAPLSSSLFAADLLTRQVLEDADPRLCSTLAILRRSLYQQMRTYRNLSYLLRLTKKDAFPLLPLDLAGLLREFCSQAGDFLRPLPFSLSLSAPGSMLVKGVPELLRHMLLNLLSNSIAGGATEASIRLHTHGGQCRITIRDNGTGISDRALQLSHLPLFSGEEQSTTLSAGLALCRTIAEHHGGSLLLHTGADGTTCTITLPPLEDSERFQFHSFEAYQEPVGCEDLYFELSDVLPDEWFLRLEED